MKNNRNIYKVNSSGVILGIAAGVLFLFFASLNSYIVKAADETTILSVSVSANRTTVSPGQEIIYTIVYRNTGSAPATGIIVRNSLTDTNQNYLEFVSANPVPDSGNNTWIIDGPFRAGESGKITLTARITTALPSNWLTIRNRASIDSNETVVRYSNYASIFINSSCRLVINQTVRNVTENSLFGDSINAGFGDEVEFLTEIEVVGTNQALDTRIWDRLSSRLKYISGSAIIDGSSLNDKIVNDGVYVGNLLTGAKKTIKFRATVDSSGRFYVGKNYLRSYGYVDADICMAKASIATVVVDAKKTTNSLGVITSSGLTISKSARNITKKSNSWSSSVIYANPGDEIEFLIKIKSTSEETNSVRVEDVLPPKMYYISDSTTVDGNYQTDGITTNNVYLPYVYRNIVKEVKFRVKIAGENAFNIYPISLVNEAFVWGNDGKEITDTVKLIINKPSQSSVKNTGIGSDKDSSQPNNQELVINDKSEEVKGAAIIKTGFNYFKFFVILMISGALTIIFYCRIREEKLLEIFNNKNAGKFRKSFIGLYFKVKLLLRVRILKLKKYF